MAQAGGVTAIAQVGGPGRADRTHHRGYRQGGKKERGCKLSHQDPIHLAHSSAPYPMQEGWTYRVARGECVKFETKTGSESTGLVTIALTLSRPALRRDSDVPGAIAGVRKTKAFQM